MTANPIVVAVGHSVDLLENQEQTPKEMPMFLKVRIGRNRADGENMRKTVLDMKQDHGEIETTMVEGDIGGRGAGQETHITDTVTDLDPEIDEGTGSMQGTGRGLGVVIVIEGEMTAIGVIGQENLEESAEGRLPEIASDGQGAGRPITSMRRDGRRSHFQDYVVARNTVDMTRFRLPCKMDTYRL